MKSKPRSCSNAFARLALQPSTPGFTLLEMMVISAMIGILLAISVPGWLSFLHRQQLNTAQNEVLQAVRTAQSQAKLQHILWQASLRESNQIVQWAIHPANATPADSQWQSLDPAIQLDAETTLLQTHGIRRIQFSPDGGINGQLGRVTFSSRNISNAKRCIIFSTLLGTTRTSQEQSKPQDGKYCY